MKQLTCEMCGSTELLKQDGVFVCQTCGTKYSVEEAKKMMVEGTVDVSGSTVKVDTSGELENLYQIARRAKDDNNSENATKYYDMILVKDPTSWEATFYVVYFKAMSCKIAEIGSAAVSVNNCVKSTMQLIKENVQDPEEQRAAYTEVTTRTLIIEKMLYSGAKNHFQGISAEIRNKYRDEFCNRAGHTIQGMITVGDQLEAVFGDQEEAQKLAVMAWKQAVDTNIDYTGKCLTFDQYSEFVRSSTTKIKKYEPSFSPPLGASTAGATSNGGCYVATAVYGSYDCPQVWTLRRYRDYTLAETWYGRAFIRTYYAISPTLVKWFGNTKWFKKMWRGKLDSIVENLQNKGIKSTPYRDRIW